MSEVEGEAVAIEHGRRGKPITPSRAGGLKGNRQRRLQRILGQELGLHEDGSFSCN